MPRSRLATILAVLGTAPIACSCGYAAAAEEEGEQPATVQAIEGSDRSRVILTQAAAKRIGLATTAVVLRRVDRDLVVRGRVLPSPAGARGSLTVEVPLLGGELGEVDRTRSARVLGARGAAGLVASPAPPPPGAESGALYYRLDGARGDLRPGQQVRMQVSLAGGGERPTIPYSAVIYWIDGGTYTYVTAKPLAFVRSPIEIERVEGDIAVLAKGPPAGTEVVTVGAEEILGTEFEIEGE